MAKEVYALDAESYATVLQMRRWQRNFRVTGAARMVNTPEGCTLSIPEAPTARERRDGFWARVTGVKWDTTGLRWRSYAEEVTRAATDTSWTVVSGGRTATGDPPGGGIDASYNGTWLLNADSGTAPFRIGQVAWVFATLSGDAVDGSGAVIAYHREWWCDVPAPVDCAIQISGTHTAPGCYEALLLSDQISGDVDTEDTGVPAVLTYAGSPVTVIAVNFMERNAADTGHSCATDDVYPATYASTNADGTQVYTFWGTSTNSECGGA